MHFEQEEHQFKKAIEQILAVMYWINDAYEVNEEELLDQETYRTLFPQAFELWKEWKNNGL